MNWGTKLIIGMLSFMSFIVVLGVLMIRSSDDALVENNYYEKGLNYDQVYAAKTQVGKDQARPKIEINSQHIDITFTTEASGSIKLRRNDSKASDTTIQFNSPAGKVTIPTKNLARGPWNMITSWENAEGTKYLREEEIKLP